MISSLSRAIVVALLLLPAGILLAGCGSAKEEPHDSGKDHLRVEAPKDAKRGGQLTVLAAGDIDSLDPGNANNQFSYMIAAATQRRLLTQTVGGPDPLAPDLAESLPEVDKKRGTITLRIKPGTRFSPPVNRKISAADFKYAIDRLVLPGVASGSADMLLDGVVGVKEAKAEAAEDPTKAPDIRGVTTPEPMVLQIRFSPRIPPLATFALTLPAVAPVPAEYARSFDATVPSRYSRYAVGSGPYMVENDARGKLTGHRPGVELKLTRNPNWDPETDHRGAFVDRIRVQSGYVNTRAASEKILDGSDMINGDFAPDPVTLREASTQFGEQLMMVPAGSVVFASLNTTIPPLDNMWVRRAVVAVTDRLALQRVRGGTFSGELATHFIPPGVDGFEEAGGLEGPGFEFLSQPSGDTEMAASFMKKAGYSSGTYSGEDTVQIVTDTTSIGRRSAEVMRQALDRVGIASTVKAVARETMYTGFCNVPSAEVAICPNVGLVRFFNDPQTMLVPGFSGNEINPVNNSNWAQLDVPAINDAMLAASRLEAGPERAAAWGRIDRMITAQAPAVPAVWNEIGLLSSKNVINVLDPATATSDLSEISLTNPCGEEGEC